MNLQSGTLVNLIACFKSAYLSMREALQAQAGRRTGMMCYAIGLGYMESVK